MHISNTGGLKENLTAVRERIRRAAEDAGRDAAGIRLLAVGKRQPLALLRIAFDLGQRDFGENQLQEALDKMAQWDESGVIWHFVGSIQSNKTRQIAERFDWVHSVDRIKIARRLSEQRPDHLEALNVCIQVNVSGESSKSGIDAALLNELAERIVALPRLKLRGLMAIPAPSEDYARQRQGFARLCRSYETLCEQGYELDTLSMGMSADLEAAVAEGSTLLRIGSAIFGARPD